MAIFTVTEKDTLGKPREYTVDTYRHDDGREEGDINVGCTPFYGIPIRLHIAIRKNGGIAFRSWDWADGENHYLHLLWEFEGEPTENQIDTVNGLFSGRIKFDGTLKLAVGATLQDICPIDVEAEEKKIGKKIYLA